MYTHTHTHPPTHPPPPTHTHTTDLHHCSRLLCQAAVEVIVRERFGSKCLRIFRLLLLKKILEQWQVVEMAMIPGKESRELLYSLLAENFVTLQVSFCSLSQYCWYSMAMMSYTMDKFRKLLKKEMCHVTMMSYII